MGRSGGGSSGGGGGGSGGFSGGGRVGGSGGFSGGRSGRSGGGRSSPHPNGGFSGSRHSPPPRRSAPPSRRQGGIHTGPIFVNASRPNYRNNNQRHNGGGGGSQPPSNGGRGCGATVLIVVLIFALFIGVMVMMNPNGETSSTIQREKLLASAVQETAYYTDMDGDWIHNASKLENGLRKFYRETGVQPYVYILPNGAETSITKLSQQAETLYNQLFQDAGHFLLLFCDDGVGGYNCGYTYGAQARTVMDDEAIQILAEYLDACYADTSLSEEEIFSSAFEDTASRIMTVTKSPVEILASSMKPLAVVMIVIIAVALILKIVKARREAQEREQRRTEEILNTPLEKFGDTEAEELAKKYEDK